MSSDSSFLSRPVLYGIGIFLLISAIYLVTRHPPTLPGDASNESTLVLYSGRSEDLIRELLQRYEEETGTKKEETVGAAGDAVGSMNTSGKRWVTHSMVNHVNHHKNRMHPSNDVYWSL